VAQGETTALNAIHVQVQLITVHREVHADGVNECARRLDNTEVGCRLYPWIKAKTCR
jgi:hypothetical protein